MKRILSIVLFLISALPLTAQEQKPGKRWPKKEAAEWHKQYEWQVGCNFIPSTAVNQLEMWQKETFDRQRFGIR